MRMWLSVCIIVSGLTIISLVATPLLAPPSSRTGAAQSDLIIVGLGDSLASGEGNPDTPKQGKTRAIWQDERCDRSAHSFQAQVARRLEAADAKTSVKFVHLACSGASIPQGLTGSYAGINPPLFSSALPAQVSEARRLMGSNRTPDAVLLSVGVNDLGFGSVAKFCARSGKSGYCPNNQYQDGLTLEKWLAQQLQLLPERYAELARALADLGPKQVFIIEYPDLLRDDQGNLCKLIYFRPGVLYGDYQVKEREVKWLNDFFYLPLNAAVKDAAAKYNWQFIGGSAKAFANHGYCANDHWIVRYNESEQRQGNTHGALHPNLQGHTALANLLFPVLRDSVRR